MKSRKNKTLLEKLDELNTQTLKDLKKMGFKKTQIIGNRYIILKYQDFEVHYDSWCDKLIGGEYGKEK